MKGNAYMAISEIVITEDMKEYRNIAARYHNFSDNFNAKIMRISKLRFSSGGAAVSRRFSLKRVGRNLAMAIIVAVLSLQGMISMLADAPKESTLEYGLKTRPVANGMLEVNFLDDQTVGELNLPAGELTLPAVVDYHSPTYFPEGYYVTDDVKEIVKKASNNGEIIFSSTQRDIFNGIFSYEYSDRKDHLKYQFNNLNYFTLPTQVDDEWIWTEKTNSQVNHILLGSSIFIKFYPYTRIRRANDFDVNEPHLNIYDMKNDLALAYFISNLQEFILYRTTKPFLERMPEELLKFFYPIPETKEIYLFEKLTKNQNF